MNKYARASRLYNSINDGFFNERIPGYNGRRLLRVPEGPAALDKQHPVGRSDPDLAAGFGRHLLPAAGRLLSWVGPAAQDQLEGQARVRVHTEFQGAPDGVRQARHRQEDRGKY